MKTVFCIVNIKMTSIKEHGLFLSQFFFSAVGVGFSISMLVRGKDPSIYLPILTTIIGVWTPNPLAQHKSANEGITSREPRLESVIVTPNN
jgi:hypothetical protein